MQFLMLMRVNEVCREDYELVLYDCKCYAKSLNQRRINQEVIGLSNLISVYCFCAKLLINDQKIYCISD